MIKPIRFVLGALAVASLTFAPGCGGGDGLGKRVPITGKVTYNGQPVKKGQISFVPEASDGHAATAQIVNGEIKEASTLEANDGILPGKYKVAISAQEDVDVSDVTKKYKAMPDPAELAKARAAGKKLIPDKYTNALDSGLTADIATPNQVVTFDLND
jgi:hypothetical protein